ncbi:hypothetical protein ZIOFF_004281 [Zingiber officinale]|uniref:Uncharacterized protein n=1 Tax=Zingiber officinale TaxID=94328 RepID=A0A8J5IB31_ZINOF|nr:hypothetical protein ZIOFF_004281 [Zingiber officinale]
MEARRGEVKQTVQMVGGDGEYSYAANSLGQKKLIIMTKSMLENAIEQMFKTLLLKRITIVDLGCASGPNTLLVLSQVLDIISKLHEQSKEETLPEIQFILNDLPSNDFNSVFQSLEEFKKKIKEERENLLIPYYVAAVPGSFHERLFPSSTVHFFHSSTSLHWLSQSRFEELSVGGGAWLTFPGRDHVDGDSLSHLSELLADSLNAMAEEGIISKAKLDALYFPLYVPLLEEVKSIILGESSFHIEQAHLLSNNIELYIVQDGKKIANSFRAGIESFVAHHFGDAILDELFERFAEKISRSILEEKLTKCNTLNIVIVLKKNTPQ